MPIGRSRTSEAVPGKRQGLPRHCRLLRALEFQRVYARGERAHGQALVVVALRRTAPGFRLGVSVSKEHGAAVRRNKIKRLLREAFRLERERLPGAYDLVLIPRKRTGKYALAELRGELSALLRQIELRLPA
jgi:ribonuclease P protein component